MRKDPPNRYRVKTGEMASTDRDGMTGAFVIPRKVKGRHAGYFAVISNAGTDLMSYGWEHVSVSLLDSNKKPMRRVPTWKEMCEIKGIFWEEEETVVQYHPPQSEYVNTHKYVLHLWRSTREAMPRPPKILVG